MDDVHKWLFARRFKEYKGVGQCWHELSSLLNRPMQTVYDHAKKIFLRPHYKSVMQMTVSYS